MAASLRTLCFSVLQKSFEILLYHTHFSLNLNYFRNGLSRSGSEFGPLTDLPDWSFADGRPAPPLKGHLRRRQEREDLARRIVMLSLEVDRGMEMWAQKQEEAKLLEEERKSKFLKPKGRLLMKKDLKS
uniref:Large ribosomal subunit protein mL52 n=1 Tax=Periophthalmus magnuspinnatus TaxID=409849 RepID=A0A3B4B1E0_9GOBI